MRFICFGYGYLVLAVDNEVISRISQGLMVLVGIGSDDNDTDVSTLSKKILSLRVFAEPSNPDKMWKANVKDIDGDILCVSQFTLLANTTKGNKPDFHRAMATEPSRRLYATFLDALKVSYKADKIQGGAFFFYAQFDLTSTSKDGRFGAMMSVNLTNEGPITFTLDSRKFEYIEVPENSKTSRTLNNTVQLEATSSGAIGSARDYSS